MPRKDIHETTERVVFNGVPYRRYPNSARLEMRRYFIASGGQRLHRAIWEFHNGPIPKGHHVHHKDENTLNNDISNLECLPNKAHRRAHWSEERAEKQREIAAKIRPLTKAWHASEEGRDWHSEHARKIWADREPEQKTCAECAGTFESKTRRAADRFCSNACKLKNYGKGITSKCPSCGNNFPNHKYQPRECCSVSCARKLAAVRRQEANGGRLETRICGCGKQFQDPKQSKKKGCSASCSAKQRKAREDANRKAARTST